MISYQSIAQECATFNTNTQLTVGAPCKMGYNNAVIEPMKDEPFIGVVLWQRNSYATVALRGFVTVKYSGTAPAVGRTGLYAGEDGTVVAAEGAPIYLVVETNTVDKTVTFLM